jgi:hypothetical protein
MPLLVTSFLCLLGWGFFLERRGVFLYLGYTQVGIVGSFIAMAFFFSGVHLLRSRRILACYLCVALSVGVIVAAWTVGSLHSSPRKQFYLSAIQIQPGESIEAVRSRMARYESWQKQEGYLSFGFASTPGIFDVVIVHYDSKTGKVLDYDLSLD